LRTPAGLSRLVRAETVLTSLIMFAVIYALLFAVFIFLLNEKIQHGPDDVDLVPSGKLTRHKPGGVTRSVAQFERSLPDDSRAG